MGQGLSKGVRVKAAITAPHLTLRQLFHRNLTFIDLLAIGVFQTQNHLQTRYLYGLETILPPCGCLVYVSCGWAAAQILCIQCCGGACYMGMNWNAPSTIDVLLLDLKLCTAP